MSTITQGNTMLNGISLAMQQYIELRSLNAQFNSTESPNPRSDDLTAYRTDAAFECGVPTANIVP